MAADIPALRELDINPLLVDADGVLALDARVAVAPSRQLHRGRGHPRFAVLPYPKELERNITLADGRTAFVRPVRPEDRSEENTSELQSLMRISYAVFCLKKKI